MAHAGFSPQDNAACPPPGPRRRPQRRPQPAAGPRPTRPALPPPAHLERPSPSTLLGGPAFLTPAPCTKARAAEGRPNYRRPPRSWAGPLPFPTVLVQLGSTQLGGEKREARGRGSQSDTPASRSGPYGPVRGRSYAPALPALCTWFRTPSRGDRLPTPRSNSRASGPGEAPTRPLPQALLAPLQPNKMAAPVEAESARRTEPLSLSPHKAQEESG